MPFSPSLPSDDGPQKPVPTPSGGKTTDGRVAGFSAEEQTPDIIRAQQAEGVYVSDYAYQENNQAFLKLTIYDPEQSAEAVEVSTDASTWTDITGTATQGVLGEDAQVAYTYSLDFNSFGAVVTVYWRVNVGGVYLRGSHEFDRDRYPEADVSLTLQGNDLFAELDGDEDVEAYLISFSRSPEDGFLDPTTDPDALYVAGRERLGLRSVLVGYLPPQTQAFVTVLPYGTAASDPNTLTGLADPGFPIRRYFSRGEQKYLRQARFRQGTSDPYTRDPVLGDVYMSYSDDGGVNWSKDVRIANERSAVSNGDVYESYRFARAIGAPEIDPDAATPGPDWQDAPSEGFGFIWFTKARFTRLSGTDVIVSNWTTPVRMTPEVTGDGIDPSAAIAEYSTSANGPWGADYASGDDYMRISWDQGANWYVAEIVEQFQAGQTESINRFARGDTPPNLNKNSYTSPGAGWEDVPPSGNQKLWFISGRVQYGSSSGNGTLVDDWSDPIEIREATGTYAKIEFGETEQGPWHPDFRAGDEWCIISESSGADWQQPIQLSTGTIYFVNSDSEPTLSDATNPVGSGFTSFPQPGVSPKRLWFTRKPAPTSTFSDPQIADQDFTQRGPVTDTVFIQYSRDQISWRDQFQPGDLWMRQRLGAGVWSQPIRIVGEDGAAGADGQYVDYRFQANDDPNTGPPINGADDPNSAPSALWVDSPGDALAQGGSYVWAISARFEVNPSGSDIRLTPWSGPFRLTGEPGNDGKGIKLIMDSYVVPTLADGSLAPAAQDIGVEVALNNITGTPQIFLQSAPNPGSTNFTNGSQLVNGTQATLDVSTMNVEAVLVQAEVTDSDGVTYEDRALIVKVRDGADGLGGVSVFLSNDSYTWTADYTGTVYGGQFDAASTQILAYEQDTPIAFNPSAVTDSNLANGEYYISNVQVDPVGIIAPYTISGVSLNGTTVAEFVPGVFSSDPEKRTGQVIFSVRVKTSSGTVVPVTRTLTYSKVVDNQGFEFIKDLASDLANAAIRLGDNYEGMALTNYVMGFIAPKTASISQAQRWQAYIDAEGQFFLKDRGTGTSVFAFDPTPAAGDPNLFLRGFMQIEGTDAKIVFQNGLLELERRGILFTDLSKIGGDRYNGLAWSNDWGTVNTYIVGDPNSIELEASTDIVLRANEIRFEDANGNLIQAWT